MPRETRRMMQLYPVHCHPCHHYGLWHHHIGYPVGAPWWLGQPSMEEEKEDIREHIE